MQTIEDIKPSGAMFKKNEDGTILSDYRSICEYLNELTQNNNLMGETPKGRAEIRRITGWFDSAFYMDAFKPLVGERV